MGSIEVFLLINVSMILGILGIFWKDIFQMSTPDRFYRVVINLKDGSIKQVWHYIKDKSAKEIFIDKVPYYVVHSYRTYKGSKFFEYDQGNPIPKENKENMDDLLDLHLERMQIKYSKMLQEEEPWWKDWVTGFVGLLIGLAIGFLAASVHFQGQMIAGV